MTPQCAIYEPPARRVGAGRAAAREYEWAYQEAAASERNVA